MGEVNKRHEELSEKIFNMGFALHEEGGEKKDYTISAIGDIMVLVSGIIHSKDDIRLFSDLCAMFSAKKILDSKIDVSQFTPKSEDEVNDMLRKLRDDINSTDEEDDGLDTDLDDNM